jgi:hypothetical protein
MPRHGAGGGARISLVIRDVDAIEAELIEFNNGKSKFLASRAVKKSA